jgi:hypothetical protein
MGIKKMGRDFHYPDPLLENRPGHTPSNMWSLSFHIKNVQCERFVALNMK